MFVYDFFADLGKFYEKIGRFDSWWITTGEEIEASIFYYNQSANMVRLVIQYKSRFLANQVRKPFLICLFLLELLR